MSIEEYLAAIGTSLRVGPFARRRILRELEAHLVDAIRREEAGGATRAEAERRAVAGFGEPGILAARFSEGQRITRRWSASAGLAAAAGIAAALVVGFEGPSGLDLLHFNPSCGSFSSSLAKQGRLWTTAKTRTGGSVTCEYDLRGSSHLVSIEWTDTAVATARMAPPSAMPPLP